MCEKIEVAGLLHDLGKAMIPLEILNKPGKLTDEEFTVIKSHPGEGHKLLLEGKGVWNGQALQFLGTGRATPGNEAAMANLLSLLGRREGDHVQIAL